MKIGVQPQGISPSATEGAITASSVRRIAVGGIESSATDGEPPTILGRTVRNINGDISPDQVACGITANFGFGKHDRVASPIRYITEIALESISTSKGSPRGTGEVRMYPEVANVTPVTSSAQSPIIVVTGKSCPCCGRTNECRDFG